MWAVYVLGRWRRRREQELALSSIAEFSRDVAQLPVARPLQITATVQPRAALPQSRRLMGICLVGDLLATVITAFLALINVLPWKCFFISVLAGVVLVAGLRASVVRSRDVARRQVARSRRRLAESGRRRRRSLIREVVARRAAARVGPIPAVELAPEAVGGEGDAVEAVAEPSGDTWEPIPVPRPTYQMKARAPVAAPIPVAPPAEPVAAQAPSASQVEAELPGNVAQGPAAVELAATEVEPDQPEFDLDAVLERRIAANE